jgi:hypothetical protein
MSALTGWGRFEARDVLRLKWWEAIPAAFVSLLLRFWALYEAIAHHAIRDAIVLFIAHVVKTARALTFRSRLCTA